MQLQNAISFVKTPGNVWELEGRCSSKGNLGGEEVLGWEKYGSKTRKGDNLEERVGDGWGSDMSSADGVSQ